MLRTFALMSALAGAATTLAATLHAQGPTTSNQVARPHTAYDAPAGPHVDPRWYRKQRDLDARRRLRTPKLGYSGSQNLTHASPAPVPTNDPAFGSPAPLAQAPSRAAVVQPQFTQQLPNGAYRIGDYVQPRYQSRIRIADAEGEVRPPASPQPSTIPMLETRRPAADASAVERRATDGSRDVDSRRETDAAGRLERVVREAPSPALFDSANSPARADVQRVQPPRTPGVRRISRPGAKLRPLQAPPQELQRRERRWLPPVRNDQPEPSRASSSRSSGSRDTGARDTGARDTGARDMGERRPTARRAEPIAPIRATLLDDFNLLPAPTRIPFSPLPVAPRITLPNQQSAAPSTAPLEARPTYETTTEAAATEAATPARPTASDRAEARFLQRRDELTPLRDEIRRTLAFYFDQLENAATRSPWGMMHALLPFGVDSQLIADGRRVNSIGWLCWNGTCWDQQLLYTENGELRTRQGPGVQGHPGQFLAFLAQCKVRKDFGLRVDGLSFTVEDLVRYEMATCEPKSELTFKLIGLSHYLNSDARWTTADGERWSISRLIDEELAQEINGAACGGTHRLMGFSYCVNRRLKRGEPIDGAWLRAQQAVDAYIERIATLRNADGSYSTNWLEGRGADPDLDRRMKTTGHIIEWLVFSLPREELVKPQFIESIRYLNDMMDSNRDHRWSVGPKGHAIRALSLYDERVFNGQPGRRAAQLAELRQRLR